MRAIGSVLIEGKDLRPGLKPPEEGGRKGGKCLKYDLYFKKWAEMRRMFEGVKEGQRSVNEEDSMLENSSNVYDISWGTHSLWICTSGGNFLFTLQEIKLKIC